MRSGRVHHQHQVLSGRNWVRDAEVHAEPEEQAMFLMPIINDSPSTKPKEMLVMWGKRWSR